MENIGRNFVLIAISQVIIIISGFAINIFLTNYLGIELYGRYSLVITGILAIGLKLIAGGFPETMSKFVSEEKYDLESLISGILFYQMIEAILLTIILMAISPLLAISLNENNLLALILLASPIIIGQGLVSYFVCLYNGMRKFKIQSLIVILQAIFKIIFVIIGGYYWKIEGAIIGFLLSTLLVAFIFIFKARKHLGRKLSFKIPKEIFSYMFEITVFGLCIILFSSLDILSVRYLIKGQGSNLVGIYNAGATVSRLSLFLILSLSGVMFPTISNLIAKNDKENAKEQIGQMIKISSIFIIPIVLLLSSFSKNIIEILYKPEYIDSFEVNRYLVFAYSILGFFVVFSNIINAIGKVKITIIISVVTILLDVILLYFLVTYIGIIGATIATLIATTIGLIVLIIVTYKQIGINVKLITLFKINSVGIILFGVLNYILVYFFTLKFYFWIFVVIGEIIIYFILLGVLKEFNALSLMKSIILKLKEYFSKNANNNN